MSGYLKRVAAPKSWKLFSQGRTAYIAKPQAGPHGAQQGMPIALLLKNLGYCRTAREAKKILNTKKILVDGRRVLDYKFPAGLMDTLSFPDTKEVFRIVLDYKGRLKLVPAKQEEAGIKPCKIVGKTKLKQGKTQINLFDSRNIIVEKDDFKTGDTVLIELPSQKIIEHLKLEKGAKILLHAGKHAGKKGIIEEISEDKIVFDCNGEKLRTLKSYAFVICDEKRLPSLT